MRDVILDGKGQVKLILARGSWCRPIRDDKGRIVELEPVDDQAAAREEARRA